MGVEVLSRRLWGADPLICTAGAAVPESQFVGLVIHHDVIGYTPTSSPDDVAQHARAVQTARPDISRGADGRPEAPYSFGIAEHTDPESAFIIELRGVGRSGAHTIGYNSTRYGIALFGDYSDRSMTPGMIRAIRALGALILRDTDEPAPTLAHRQVYATACPGGAAMAQLPYLQPPFTIPNPMEGQSMTITPEDRDALGLTFVPSREYSADGTFTETAALPVAQHTANAHIEAQRARLAAEQAERQAEATAGNVSALHELLISESRAVPTALGEVTAELLAEAFTIALRRLLNP